MPFLQLGDARFPLRIGENRVGGGSGVAVALPGSMATDATITVGTHGASLAPAASGNAVRLNGVAIHNPAPVLHGDRVAVGELELRYGDEGLHGETVSLAIDPGLPIAVPSAAAAVSRQGGRLVSQIDGREYEVGPEGLVVGRDVTCDVVLARPDVSRRHLTIRHSALGYLLLDTSANGVLVNGARVLTEVALGRGDRISIGPEEFRFHAVEGEAAPRAEVPQLAVTGTFAAARRPTPVATPMSVPRFEDRRRLAALEVINEGPTKGLRFDLYAPRTDIGRGGHNDIVIPDESVSDTHSRLQQREDGWYLFDLGSTNGTYHAGVRLGAEGVRVLSGDDVRFGGVKMRFRADIATARPSGETRVIVGVKGPDPKRLAERTLDDAVETGDGGPPAAGWGRTLLWLVLLTLVALIVWTATAAGKP